MRISRGGDEPAVRVADGHVAEVNGLLETGSDHTNERRGSAHEANPIPSVCGQLAWASGELRFGASGSPSSTRERKGLTTSGSNCEPAPA